MAIDARAHLLNWLERIDALELRERLLLLAAIIVTLFLLIDTLVLQPTLKAQQITEEHISDLQNKLHGLQQNARLLAYKTYDDPLGPRNDTKRQLTEELADLDARILNQLGALVEPAQAAEVLEQVLGGQPRLKLTSLSASARGLDSPQGEQASVPTGLARYQLDMVLAGSYLDVLSYLQTLESMPWKFFWQRVDFQSTDHPRAETRIQLYTLGAEDA